MRGLLAPRVRNDSPVPLVSRAASGLLSGWFNRRDAVGQLEMMATNGTVYGIVNRTSTAVAKTEWHLYRSATTGKDEDRVEVTKHLALDVINQPNKFFTRMELFETAQQHLDLPGEAALVIGRDQRARNLPLELWPVRPDRLDPVPHPTKYLAGWIYTSPDGERVPLAVDEVLHIRMPNPMDPYRGLGPVGSVLTEAVSARYAAEWNANFFRDSAEPGGIIEVDRNLDDDEFDQLTARWEEQHRGVARAHRVAIIEQGMKWIDRKYTQRDMEFTALRGVTRDAILEAYGFPKSMLGITEDVNRANAEAGELVFAKWLTVPRLDRWRDVLNAKFLPLFGNAAKGLEFDYDSPVPEDEAAENAGRTSKADAAQKLIAAGFTGESVQEALELPDALVWEKPAPPPPPVAPDSAGPTPAEPGAPIAPAAPEPPVDPVAALLHGLLRDRAPVVLNADGWPESDEDAVNAVDLGPVQVAWEAALAALLSTWQGSVVVDWIRQLITAVRGALGGDRGGLATLDVDIDQATSTLRNAMTGFAQVAAGRTVAEASAAGVDLAPKWPDAADLEVAARQVADFEARRLALAAGREAARIAGPDPDVDVVADHLDQFLNEISDAGAKQALGGALTDAQNLARAETLAAGPVGALYASEQMDSNTCAPCREVHGRWICTTDDLGPLWKLYPAGGYIDCLGRWRCRGSFVGVWRPETTKGGQ